MGLVYLKTILIFYIFSALLGNMRADSVTSNETEATRVKRMVDYDDKYFLSHKELMQNVARGKPATQLSTYQSYVAGLAVDGNTNTDVFANSCCHTQHQQAYEWWQVDLGRMYRIYFIDITPRWDKCVGCRGRLHDFDVDFYDGNPSINGTHKVPCFHHAGALISPKPVSMGCANGPTNGQVVRITNAFAGLITLCEVQIYGKPLSGIPIQNLAIYRPATQSSTYGKSTANLAVDGYKNPNPAMGSCAQTQMSGRDTREWWRVDLGFMQNIYSVSITPRFYCPTCNYPTKKNVWNFYVDIYTGLPNHPGTSMQECLTNQYMIAFAPYTRICDPAPIRGRVVQIVGGYYSNLILCEVEIFGLP